MTKPRISVQIGNVILANPVIAASGTFGYGEEYSKFFRVSALGALVTKTITIRPKVGNPPPRLAETASGMLNSIGLENKGIEDFIANRSLSLKKMKLPVFVSIAGERLSDFVRLTKLLRSAGYIAGIELNLSCPNIGRSTGMIAQDPNMTRRLVRAVKREARHLAIIAKLSPKVTDIGVIAKAAEQSGADAVSLINTVPGIAVDIRARSSKLGMLSGGLSGPAIKPIALNLAREAYRAVRIPVIGMGGIMTWEDVIEFIIAGSCAVQIGTANFVDPKCSLHIVEGIRRYLSKEKIRDIKALVGTLRERRA